MESEDQLMSLERSKIQIYSQRVFSASIGGSAVALLVTPFDVVKARLQAQVGSHYRGVACTAVGEAIPHGPERFHGMVDAFLKIRKTEGITSLWKGLRPTLMMQLPGSALYFPIYELVRERLAVCDLPNIWIAPMVAGILGRMITATVVSPLELVRTNLQANAISDVSIDQQSMRRSFVNIVRRHGWMQLWGGLGPTLIRDVPFSGVYWGGYEFLKLSALARLQSDSEMPLSKTQRLGVDFYAGATAGCVAAIISNPFDVIKTHRQMSLSSTGSGASTVKEICQQIIKEDGWRGFTRGILPRTAKVAPGCAIMISTYEFCKQLFSSA